MRKLLVILAAVALLAGCTGKNKVAVKGTMHDKKGQYVVLTKLDVDKPVRLDSVKLGGSGKFSFSIDAQYPEFYKLGLSDNEFITLLAEPGEKIRLQFNGPFMGQDYSVKGSEGTLKIMKLDSALAVTKVAIDSLKKIYDSGLGKPGFDMIEKSVDEKYISLAKKQRLFNIGFILENLGSFASIKALYQRLDDNAYVLYDARDLQFFKLVSDTLGKYYPESKQVKSLKLNFEAERSRQLFNKIGQMAQEAPETKLDPSLKDINGEKRVLSSLKGKYVLLAFWTASSSDCVAENLELKKLYNLYHSRGFEIYQISVDTNEETWRKAVKFDELPWINCREDDPANPRNALIYNVRSVPANFLYDKEGNIIGRDLHGRALQLRLNQIFGV
ncbi:MAG: TlpA disulfide reductase family protein [Bacteroidales bacterium]